MALVLLAACVPLQKVQPIIPTRDSLPARELPTPLAPTAASILESTTVTAVSESTAAESSPELRVQLDDRIQTFIKLNTLAELNTPAAKELFIGELADWDAPSIGEITTEPVQTVTLPPAGAVTRIQVQAGYSFDVYVYWLLDSTWRITAMRAMSLPAGIREMYVELRDKQNLTPDETEAMTQLTPFFLTDDAWQKWFIQNQDSLETLCARSAKILADGTYAITQANIDSYSDIEDVFTALGVSAIEKEGANNLQIIMAGMIDNTVGFICSTNGTPPPMSSSGFIWIEKVDEGWFFFRTT